MDLHRFLFCFVLLLNFSSEQNFLDEAPRIITENGNIIFQTALTKSIRFQTLNGGQIQLNDIDLNGLSNEVKAIRNTMDQLKDLKKCNCELINSNINNNLKSIETQQASLTSSMDRITSLSVIIVDIKQKLMYDDCATNPCHNGGTCVDGYNMFKCICPENFKGTNCNEDVDECVQLSGTDLGCQNNAQCQNYHGGFRCICVGKWTGVLCNLPSNGCAGSSNTELCGHGTCIPDNSPQNVEHFKCICDIGWSLDHITRTCTIDINECETGRYPCSVHPLVKCNNFPGHFTCDHCPIGFEGNGFQCKDINECSVPVSQICGLNEECINTFGSYSCQCVTGMRRGNGGICQRENICEINNGGCNIYAICTMNTFRIEGRTCTCNPGYSGSGEGINGCTLLPTTSNTTNRSYRRCVRRELCQNGGRCQATADSFICQCAQGFSGPRCRIVWQNPCIQNPCKNDGTCEFLIPNHYRCHCKPLYTGANCEIEHSDCGGNIISPREDLNISLMISQASQARKSLRFPCSWMIILSNEQFIQIKPISIQLTGPCSEEYVQLEEKSSFDSPLRFLGRYCQQSNINPISFNTSGSVLFIKAALKSGIAQTHGFSLKLIPTNSETEYSDCCHCLNSTHRITNATNGLLQSPHYPLKYGENYNCIVMFQRELGQRYKVELHLKTLNLGDIFDNCQNSDFLKIEFVESGEINITACNQETFYQRKFITSGFKVKFFSDSRRDVNSTRFQLSWKESVYRDECGSDVNINPVGLIQAPAFTSDTEIYCTWKVQHNNFTKIMMFKGYFENWVDGDCSVYIKIVNVNIYDQHIIQWENCQTREMLDEFTEQINGDVGIIFRKSKGVSTPPFRIKIEYVCGISVDMDKIDNYEFQSNNYPNNYEENSSCYYILKSQTRLISVNFTNFDINDESPCNSDYLEVIGSNTPYLDKRFCNGNKGELIPIDKYSGFSSIVFYFKTNSSISGGGFRALVTTFECGGSYFIKHKLYIAYPETYMNESTYHLNHQYNNNKNCIWDIYTTPGKYMFVLFDHFHLEYHANCNYDYLSVSYDNKTRKFCGNFAENFYTTSNRLRIQFVSDYTQSGEGFQLRIYSSLSDRQCHQIIESNEGIIYGPAVGTLNRPFLCYYLIKVAMGRKVVINVTINGAGSSNTVNNLGRNCFGESKIKIINGLTGSTTIANLCQNNPQQGSIITSYNVATIMYMVPMYQTALEFNYTISFTSIDEECGSIHNDEMGDITSPNYPLYAPRSSYCRWQIQSTPGNKIQIKILHLRSGSVDETNRCNDRVPVIKIISSTKEVDIICSSHTQPRYLFDDQVVTIIFNNLYNSNYRFLLNYKKVCTLTSNAISGRIESKIIYSGRSCLWTLTSLRGSSIAIQIDQLELPQPIDGVCKSFVEITDSRGTLMRKTCGSGLRNRTYLSSNLPIKIRHYVDRSIPINLLKTYNGLVLEYQTQGCVSNIHYDPHEDYGYRRYRRNQNSIANFQYPNAVSGIDCSWTFQTIPGYSIKLTFDVIELDSFVNCSKGSILKAWENQNTNDDYVFETCHRADSTNPIIFQSTTHTLFLKFFSANESDGGQRKFHATYEFINTSCEYELSLTEGTIQSPKYPNKYPPNLRCKWNLKVRESMSIHLRFLDFHTENTNCNFDFVEISAWRDDELMRLTKLCGQLPNISQTSYESISNRMLVTFRTDHSLEYKGFKAKLFEGCGGIRLASEENKFIFSPNYPHDYHLPDGFCEWSLVSNISNPGERIFFYFMGFESSNDNPLRNCSENGNDIPDNSLTVFDGIGDTISIKAILCSTGPYHPIVSSGHDLKLVLRSSSGHAIFKASYGTGSSSCGGLFYLDDGILTSPFYPNAVNMEIDCQYIIQNSPGSEIELNFEELTRLNDQYYLPHDFIDIRNGPNSTSPYVGRFYTLSTLRNVTSNMKFNNSVWIRLRSQGGEYTNNIKFLAKYHISYINDFRSDQGSLASPQFGHSYNKYTRKIWKIDAETSNSLDISFEQFSVGRKLENGECDRGRLKITDSNNILKEFCGPSIPQTETYSTPVTVELSAEGYRYPGFLLRWSVPKNFSHTQIGNCKFKIQATNSLQILTSPNYPNFDPINTNCEWSIITNYDNALEIKMLNFSLEDSENCKFENFSVFFIGRRPERNFFVRWIQDRICGSQNASRFNFFDHYYFNRIRLTFKVDQYDIFPGFKLSYKLRCYKYLRDLTDGWIQNDEYPNTMTDYKNCTYILSIRAERYYKLNFTRINLPPKINNVCVNGYIELSYRIFKERYCGSDVPSNLTSILTNSNRIVIKLIGNFTTYSPYSGFQLKYSLEDAEECGGNHYLSLPNDYLILTNPRNKSIYSPQFIECQWIIRSTYGSRFKIDFEDININGYCDRSYLAFYDGYTKLSPQIGNNYCKKTNSIFSTGNVIFIEFRNINRNTRFQIRITKSSCGGILYRPRGSISSPNYPLNYPNKVNCTWSIKVRRASLITVTIEELDLDHNCSRSSLIFYNTEPQLEGLIWTSCNLSTTVFHIPSSHVQINFTTDTSTTRKGFKLTYRSAINRCGGSFNQLSMEIKSPNYPAALPYFTTCQWQIEVDVSRRIFIQIKDINLRNACLLITGVYTSYLKIFCNYKSRTMDIDTAESAVLVSLYSKTGNRIWFSYHSDLPSLCGNHLYPELNGTGEISITNVSSCHYIIHNYPEKEGTVAIKLLALKEISCQEKSIKINSEILSGSSDAIVDSITTCTTSNPANDFVTLGKKINFIYSPTWRNKANLTNLLINASYKHNRCGGLLTEPFGIITSPNYPDPYPDLANCEWVLKAPDDKHIKLFIRTLHLEHHLTCKFDYLYIRYGSSFDSPLFKQFCGKHNIENETIIFHNNKLRLSFHSDITISKNGFLIEYTFVNSIDNCNGIIFDTFGSIQSPNYPRPYPNNLRCNWTVVLPKGYQAHVTFPQPFDLEMSHNNVCNYDSLKIFDSNPDKRLSVLCGNIPPSSPIISSENRIGFVFETDFNHNLDGFKAVYTPICGGIFNETLGEFSSPNIKLSPTPFLNCSYIIPAWKNHVTELRLTTNLQDCTWSNNILQIYLENVFGDFNFDRRICGRSEINIVHGLSIKIQYDGRRYYLKNYGFKARYNHDENEKVYSNITQAVRVKSPKLTSPYFHNINLLWKFYAPEGFNFFIDLIFVDIVSSENGCDYSFLAFYNSSLTNASSKVEEICGKMSDLQFKIKSNILTIQYVGETFYITNTSGFQAIVKPTPGPSFGCGGNKNVTPGIYGTLSVVDINNDGLYDNNLHCEWLLTTNFGNAIYITFENSSVNMEKRVQDECIYDVLIIYDGPYTVSPVIQKVCGNDQLNPIYSNGNNLLIVFETDVSIVDKGFRITYTAVASQNHLRLTALPSNQGLTSPGYPNNSPFDLKIYAELETVDQTDHIIVEITDLHIRPSVNCSIDKFIIQDISLVRNNKIYEMCKPVNTDFTFISLHDKVLIRYQIGPSENQVTEPKIRFSLNYKIYNCNRTEKAYSGSITNIERTKQRKYASNQYCNLTLKAPSDNLKYQFYFKHFYLEGSSNCFYDYLQFIFGKPNEQKYALPKLCGQTLPSSFVSNSSQVTIIFVSDFSFNHEGYDITYVINKNPQMKCGGDIDLDSGVITSPGFGRNYFEEGRCTWNIALLSDKVIKWKLTDFQLGNSTVAENLCLSGTNYVKITSSDKIFTFCGNLAGRTSSTLKSRSMTVEYNSLHGGTGIGFRIEWEPSEPLEPLI